MAQATQSSDRTGSNVKTIHDKETSSDGALSTTAKSGSTKLTREDKLMEGHLDTVVSQLGYNDCEKLYNGLDGLTGEEVSKLKQGSDTSVDTEKEARNVFKAWILKKGKSKATRQAVLDALDKCGNRLAYEALKDLWKEDTGPLKEEDISDIIEEGDLGPNDITSLFGALDLKQSFIDRKRQAQRSNVQLKAKAVLQGWIKKKRPTIGELLKALENADNLNASEELQGIWCITEKDPPENKDFPGEGHKLGGN